MVTHLVLWGAGDAIWSAWPVSFSNFLPIQAITYHSGHKDKFNNVCSIEVPIFILVAEYTNLSYKTRVVMRGSCALCEITLYYRYNYYNYYTYTSNLWSRLYLNAVVEFWETEQSSPDSWVPHGMHVHCCQPLLSPSALHVPSFSPCLLRLSLQRSRNITLWKRDRETERWRGKKRFTWPWFGKTFR